MNSQERETKILLVELGVKGRKIKGGDEGRKVGWRREIRYNAKRCRTQWHFSWDNVG